MSCSGRIMPDPPGSWRSWEELMELALTEARLARESGEVPVGALVISREGEIIGTGHNLSLTSHDPSAHAEITALRAAGQSLRNYRLPGSFMVVTLEPCIMCVGALIQARIAGLIYGAADPLAGAVESRLEGLELPFLNHKIWFAGQVREEKCSELLRDFFAERRA